MKDKEYAKALDEKCEALVKEGVEICDAVYDKVVAALNSATELNKKLTEIIQSSIPIND